MKLRISVRNSFHGTEMQISVPSDSKTISSRVAKKLREKICAADCRCFATTAREIQLIPTELRDGGIQLGKHIRAGGR